MNTYQGLFDWLNRVGLLLGFLSFWFAAPEILGEERLKRMEHSLATSLAPAQKLLLFVFKVFIAAGAIAITAALASLGVLHKVQNVVDLLLGLFILALVVGLLLASDLAFGHLLDTLIRRTLSRLADDTRIRQRSLYLATILFVFGFLFQFLGTF